MGLTFLHLGILLLLANVVKITCNDVRPLIHLSNELPDPTPIYVGLSTDRDAFDSRRAILKRGGLYYFTLESSGPDFFGEFNRGEGKDAKYILATLYSRLRDVKNTRVQTDLYWKIDDVGVSLSYDDVNYGPKLPWLAKTN
ncbi:hypothetical protein SASPL_128002 [Salvia splendens]|uniref:Uncharacterized protein n=1 Tax=Salvia splendens TaxID=180675 RepID=A0A8X8XAP7_SALSN|nr:hypothetical protein SASPL_128002 [Salvia splendens]